MNSLIDIHTTHFYGSHIYKKITPCEWAFMQSKLHNVNSVINNHHNPISVS